MDDLTSICSMLESIELSPIILSKRKVRVNTPPSKRLEMAEKVLNLFPGSVRSLRRPCDIITPSNFVILVKPIKGSPWSAESAALSILRQSVHSAALDNGGSITVSLLNRTVHGIVDVIKTNGFGKSDFYLCDTFSTPLIHISHKDGCSPRDFQQWSGITEEKIRKNPHIEDFIGKCKKIYGDAIPNGQSAYMRIPDDYYGNVLRMMAVYGTDYGSSNPYSGINNVDVVIQGTPLLDSQMDGTYKFSNPLIHHYGSIPSGEYEPVISIIYKGDRSQFGIGGARMSIHPIGGRNFKLEIL